MDDNKPVKDTLQKDLLDLRNNLSIGYINGIILGICWGVFYGPF